MFFELSAQGGELNGVRITIAPEEEVIRKWAYPMI
jgi:hypothetical protein